MTTDPEPWDGLPEAAPDAPLWPAVLALAAIAAIGLASLLSRAWQAVARPEARATALEHADGSPAMPGRADDRGDAVR